MALRAAVDAAARGLAALPDAPVAQLAEDGGTLCVAARRADGTTAAVKATWFDAGAYPRSGVSGMRGWAWN